jgi:hypothetical protein
MTVAAVSPVNVASMTRRERTQKGDEVIGVKVNALYTKLGSSTRPVAPSFAMGERLSRSTGVHNSVLPRHTPSGVTRRQVERDGSESVTGVSGV